MNKSAAEKVLAKRRVARLRGQAEQLEKIGALCEAFDAEHWARIVEFLKTRAENFTRIRLSGFEGMSEVELKVLSAREHEINEIVGLPATMKALFRKLSEEHAILQDRVREDRRKNKGGGVL